MRNGVVAPAARVAILAVAAHAIAICHSATAKQ